MWLRVNLRSPGHPYLSKPAAAAAGKVNTNKKQWVQLLRHPHTCPHPSARTASAAHLQMQLLQQKSVKETCVVHAATNDFVTTSRSISVERKADAKEATVTTKKTAEVLTIMVAYTLTNTRVVVPYLRWVA